MTEKLLIADYEDINECNQAWISVKDRLPKEKTPVLIFYKPIIDIGIYFLNSYFMTDKGGVYNVTHWMSLPNVPEHDQ